MAEKNIEEELIREAKLSLAKKKLCLSRAVKIVEKLLENPVTQSQLLESCAYINQGYLKDVAEERSLILMCGYPLCTKKIEKVFKQKFHISMKYNKVFDLTERKNFCSNLCYKSFKYLESQMPTCPLWLLEEEDARPIQLLPSEDASETTKCRKKSIEEDSSNLRVNFSQNAIEDDEVDKNVDEEKEIPNLESVEKSFNNMALKTKRVLNGKPCNRETILELVVKTLEEWVTLKTAEFLFPSVSKASSQIKSDELDDDLNETAFALSDCDPELLSVDIDGESAANKAMPSYEQLLSSTKDAYLNIQAYYKGKMEIVREQVAVREFKKKTPEEAPEEGEDNDTVYFEPLVDSRSQIAQRNRIVLEKVNQFCKEILDLLKFPFQDMTNDIRLLVHTFGLKATNITFRPQAWMLISLILIYMLAMKERSYHEVLSKEVSLIIIQKLLENYKTDANYLKMTCEKVLNSVVGNVYSKTKETD